MEGTDLPVHPQVPSAGGNREISYGSNLNMPKMESGYVASPITCEEMVSMVYQRNWVSETGWSQKYECGTKNLSGFGI